MRPGEEEVLEKIYRDLEFKRVELFMGLYHRVFDLESG